MDLDRSLQDLADGYRPDGQPLLEDLLTRARVRRRGLVVVSAMALVVVAAAVALAVDRGPSASRLVVTPTATASPGCGSVRISGIADYTNFVKVGRTVLTAGVGEPVTVRKGDLGEAVERITCSLEAETHGTGSARNSDLSSGTAAFLPEGTPVYAVHGFDPRCRVAAIFQGSVIGFVAADPDAQVFRPAACAVMPGLDPDGPSTQVGDPRGAPPTFVNTAKLPDCGSVDLRSGTLDTGGVAARDCLLAAIAHDERAQLRVVYRTVESGPLYKVFGAYGGRVMLYRAGVDVFGGHAQPGWSEDICDRVDKDLQGVSCGPTK